MGTMYTVINILSLKLHIYFGFVHQPFFKNLILQISGRKLVKVCFWRKKTTNKDKQTKQNKQPPKEHLFNI